MSGQRHNLAAQRKHAGDNVHFHSPSFRLRCNQPHGSRILTGHDHVFGHGDLRHLREDDTVQLVAVDTVHGHILGELAAAALEGYQTRPVGGKPPGHHIHEDARGIPHLVRNDALGDLLVEGVQGDCCILFVVAQWEASNDHLLRNIHLHPCFPGLGHPRSAIPRVPRTPGKHVQDCDEQHLIHKNRRVGELLQLLRPVREQYRAARFLDVRNRNQNLRSQKFQKRAELLQLLMAANFKNCDVVNGDCGSNRFSTSEELVQLAKRRILTADIQIEGGSFKLSDPKRPQARRKANHYKTTDTLHRDALHCGNQKALSINVCHKHLNAQSPEAPQRPSFIQLRNLVVRFVKVILHFDQRRPGVMAGHRKATRAYRDHPQDPLVAEHGEDNRHSDHLDGIVMMLGHASSARAVIILVFLPTCNQVQEGVDTSNQNTDDQAPPRVGGQHPEPRRHGCPLLPLCGSGGVVSGIWRKRKLGRVRQRVQITKPHLELVHLGA
mmetsp:Transcript_34579/g.83415  ORF Transcript_34579/g.83415 Transcript_34579/m.83415 type:complete len:495 (-) Transcript_34579:227-1711(-)